MRAAVAYSKLGPIFCRDHLSGTGAHFVSTCTQCGPCTQRGPCRLSPSTPTVRFEPQAGCARPRGAPAPTDGFRVFPPALFLVQRHPDLARVARSPGQASNKLPAPVRHTEH